MSGDESMTFDQIAELEKKVDNAVLLIADLRRENNELKEQAGQFIQQIQLKDSLIQELREENGNLSRVQQEATLGRDKEERIRNRVEQMLAKLDELE